MNVDSISIACLGLIGWASDAALTDPIESLRYE